MLGKGAQVKYSANLLLFSNKRVKQKSNQFWDEKALFLFRMTNKLDYSSTQLVSGYHNTNNVYQT